MQRRRGYLDSLQSKETQKRSAQATSAICFAMGKMCRKTIKTMALPCAAASPNSRLASSVQYLQSQGGRKDLTQATRLFELAAVQGDATAQVKLGVMHRDGAFGPPNLAEVSGYYFHLAAAQGNVDAITALADLRRVAEERRLAKEQADAADAMMEQLLAEDAEEKKAKGAAVESAKVSKSKKARRKRGGPAAARVGSNTDHRREASDAEGEARVEDCDEAQAVLVAIAPSPAASTIAAPPAALEPVPSLAEAGAAAPAPVAVTSTGRGRGRGRGRGGGRGGAGGAVTHFCSARRAYRRRLRARPMLAPPHQLSPRRLRQRWT